MFQGNYFLLLQFIFSVFIKLNAFIFTKHSIDTQIQGSQSSFGSAISAFTDSIKKTKGYLIGAPRAGQYGKVFKCLENSLSPLKCDELTNSILKKPFLGSNFTDSLLGSTIVPFHDDFIICAPNTRSETSKVLLTGHCFLLNIQNPNRVTDIRASSCFNLHNSPETHPPTYRNCQFGFSTAYSHKNFVVSTPLFISGRGIGEITDNLRTFIKSSTESVMPNQMLGYSSGTSFNIDKIQTEFTILGGPGISEKYEDTEIGGPEGIVRILSKNESIDYILKGRDFASAFGSSLLLIDINNDGLDDLVVGSPQQLVYEDRKSVGHSRYGSVHVFINRNIRERPFDYGEDELYYEILPPQELSDRSLFGTALNKLGDINGDKHQDFSISAPANDRKGSVLIYLGSSMGRIYEPVQIITGTQEDSGFGSSLSVNQIDLNGDEILDLTIGSPLSDTVSVFLGKNALNVSFSYEKKRIICGSIPGYHSGAICESIILTGYYESQTNTCFPKSPQLSLLLHLNPEAHWWNEKINRTSQFYRKTSETLETSDWPLPNNFIEGEKSFEMIRNDLKRFWTKNIKSLEEISGKNGFLIKPLSLNCKHNLQTSEIKSTPITLITRNPGLDNGQNGILLGLKWTLDQEQEGKQILKAPASYPALNSKENLFFINLRENQEPTVANDNLKLSTDITLDVESDNDGPVIYVNKINAEPISLRATVRNNGAEPIKGLSMLTKFEDSNFKLIKGDKLENSVALCKFSEVIPQDSSSECILQFLPTSSEEFSQPLTFFNTTVYRNMQKIKELPTRVEKVNMKLYVYVKAQSTIEPSTSYFSGNVSGTVGPQSGENSVGNTKVKYTITLTSQKADEGIRKSKLVVNWPYELTGDVKEQHGPYMLYLLEYPRVTYQSKYESSSSSSSTNQVTCNFNNLRRITNIYKKKLFSASTAKDEFVGLAENVDYPTNFNPVYPMSQENLEIFEEGNKLVTNLSCKNGQVRCVPIVCEIEYLSYKISPLKISFEARIWEDTNRLQFKNIHLANLLIDSAWYPDSNFQIVMHDNYQPKTSTELKMFNNMRKIAIPPKLKPLYLALGVIAGLVLLGILIVILIAAGFFKRKRGPRKLSDF